MANDETPNAEIPSEVTEPALEIERLERLLREERASRFERETTLLLALVSLLDSLARLERATDTDALDDSARKIIDRYRLVRRKVENTLEREGVQRINSLGLAVNPELHHVTGLHEAPGAAPGTITEVEEEGYLYRGSVLRAASVLVADTPTADPTPSEEET